ncbi:subtilisin-like protease [Striga asiatica]|uniref:Subtilisin-like protease n=1 Tax=Striga asiatica TaxID=4170 RepID=A0A5A7R194_STRAF|nr:subtilisin-like protease [Striga asiatica]
MASIFLTTIVCVMLCISARASSESSLQTYIIHVEEPNADLLKDLPTYYESFLPVADTLSSEAPRPRIIYSYRHVLTGFAARLDGRLHICVAGQKPIPPHHLFP